MRTAYLVLAGLLLLNVVFQFVAAGAGLTELGGDGDFSPHRVGATVAHGWALLMIVAAAVGRLGRLLIILPVVILVLLSAQYPIANSAGAAHPVVGLLIAFAAYHAFAGARALQAAGRPADTL